jgi:hypothetical protein
LQELQPLGAKLGEIEKEAGDVAAWPREARDQAAGDRVGLQVMRDDGDGGRGGSHDVHSAGADGSDDVDLAVDQLGRQRRQAGRIAVGSLRDELDLLRHPKSGGAQPL